MTKELQKKEPRAIEFTPANTPRSVMPSAGDLKKQMERDTKVREVITKFIKESMVEGKDYGSIEGKTKSGSTFQGKPTLLKPGAEKFCQLFKIRPTFRKDKETFEMLGNTTGIVAFICHLVNPHGLVVGEGRGVYKVNVERDGDYDINKAVKIAEKRAQIDAVLRTGALSDFFTQDTEDAPKTVVSEQKSYNATPKQKNYIMLLLKKLGVATSDVVEAIKGYGIEQPDQMTGQQASDLIETLNKKVKEYDSDQPKKKTEEELQNDLIAEAEKNFDKVDAEEAEVVKIDAQYIEDVKLKMQELGLTGIKESRFYRDNIGTPFAPKDDAGWVKLNSKLDEMVEVQNEE